MNIHLLRHAIAVERGTPGFEEDALRPLTRLGRSKMEAAARGMERLGLAFDEILSSPYVRARETAEIVAATLRHPGDITFLDELGAERDPADLIDRLTGPGTGGGSLLVVGHEPFLGDLAGLLLNGIALPLRFKKGGLCRISLPQPSMYGDPVLDWHLTPRQLRMLGGEQ